MIRRAPRVVRVFVATLALALGSGRAAAQRTVEPLRLVFEGAFGGSRHSVVAGDDAQLRVPTTGMMAGHLSFGVVFRPAVSAYLSEDGGADITVDGTNELYSYHTAFAELAPPAASYLALRVGGGWGKGSAVGGNLHGSGAVARVGVAARTPTTDIFALVFAVDAFTGLSGHYGSHEPGLTEIHSEFRPTSVQATLGFRLQLPH